MKKEKEVKEERTTKPKCSKNCIPSRLSQLKEFFQASLARAILFRVFPVISSEIVLHADSMKKERKKKEERRGGERERKKRKKKEREKERNEKQWKCRHSFPKGGSSKDSIKQTPNNPPTTLSKTENKPRHHVPTID